MHSAGEQAAVYLLVDFYPLQMEKTEKSMAELEIDQNLAVEFDKITEAGAQLQPLSGPG
jgi:ubiquitin carboxyl-terminal hydrolase 5/13